MWTWFAGWAGLLVSVLVTMLAGGLAGIATGSSVSTWYSTIQRPSWTPPDGVFAPVWSALYASMGVALWLACRAKPAEAAVPVVVYAAQLGLNLLWSVLFFGLRRPDLAFAEIVLLWCAILATVVVFWRTTSWAGVLLLPYLLWVTFAAVLNGAIWRMNA